MTINQVVPSDNGSRVKSAAMLGLALSVGASGVLLADGEASATDLSSVAAASASLPSVPEAGPLADSALEVAAPQAAVYHTVAEGESLWKIAQRHRVPLREIESANGISDKELLQVGQVIKVPSEQAEVVQEPRSVVTLAQVETPESAVTVAPESEDISAVVATVPTVTLARTIEATEFGEATEETTVSEASVSDAPVVTIAIESDALQSAGLTTQADGFQQELVRQDELATAEVATVEVTGEVANEPDVPLVMTLSPTLPQSNYEVQPGDTLESIAGGLGLSASDLAGANDISNPDFILAGETLSLPQDVGGTTSEAVEAEKEAPVVAAASQTIVEPSSSSQRLSYLQSTAERQVNSNTLLSNLRGESEAAVEAAASVAEADPEVQAEAVDDPYAASLVGQIRAARPQPTGATALESDSIVADEPRAARTEQQAINVEFANRSSNEARELAAAPDETLLAAAPLAPEAYIPAPRSNVGQVVSPDMPILPSSENYLPDAPDYFNGYVWPARGTFTSGYGPRWGRMHRGVDTAPAGVECIVGWILPLR